MTFTFCRNSHDKMSDYKEVPSSKESKRLMGWTLMLNGKVAATCVFDIVCEFLGSDPYIFIIFGVN